MAGVRDEELTVRDRESALLPTESPQGHPSPSLSARASSHLGSTVDEGPSSGFSFFGPGIYWRGRRKDDRDSLASVETFTDEVITPSLNSRSVVDANPPETAKVSKLVLRRRRAQCLSQCSYICLSIVWLLLFGSIIWGSVFRMSKGGLPSVYREDGKDEGRFSEERAVKLLHTIENEVGQRVTGSWANEIKIHDFIRDWVDGIVSESGSQARVQVETTTHSGHRETDGPLEVYRNITNTQILIIPPGVDPEAPFAMSNAHVDGAVGSPAASDDGVAVVVLLETLRALLHRPPEGPVLLLFNGAEEMGLLGSHAFMSQHRWAKRAKAFVNLEAAGAGGPAVLFQASNSALLSAYSSSALHPAGNVIGQDIFQSGIIPSDTDYHVFTDFGLNGVDIAFFQYGYVYHTPKDSLDFISSGSIQHMGDNTVEMLRELSRGLDEIAKDEKRGFYFDIYGLSFVTYPEYAQLVVGVGTISMAILTAWWAWSLGRWHSNDVSWTARLHGFKGCSLVFLGLLSTIFVCMISCMIFGFVGVLLGKRMFWFRFGYELYSYIVVSLCMMSLCNYCIKILYDKHGYGIPAISSGASKVQNTSEPSPPDGYFALDSPHNLSDGGEFGDSDDDQTPHAYAADKKALRKIVRSIQNHKWSYLVHQFVSVLAFWTMLVVVSIIIGIGSGYMAIVAVWGLCISFWLAKCFSFVPLLRTARSQWAASTAFWALIPISLMMPVIVMLLQMFVPLMGRFGSASGPADVVVGSLIGIITSVPATLVAPSVALFLSALIPRRHCRKYKKKCHVITGCCSAILLVAVCLVCVLGVSYEPYDSAHPKRISLQHIDEIWHKPPSNEHSGLATASESTTFLSLLGADTSNMEYVVSAIDAPGSPPIDFKMNKNFRPPRIPSVVSDRSVIGVYCADTQHEGWAAPNVTFDVTRNGVDDIVVLDIEVDPRMSRASKSRQHHESVLVTVKVHNSVDIISWTVGDNATAITKGIEHQLKKGPDNYFSAIVISGSLEPLRSRLVYHEKETLGHCSGAGGERNGGIVHVVVSLPEETTTAMERVVKGMPDWATTIPTLTFLHRFSARP